MITLSQDQQTLAMDPQHIKQRSDKWFDIRKAARVTGSTMHSALGLRGLKEQKKVLFVFY
jgi:hypothetical protein